MVEPTTSAREPLVLDLEPGTYFWCPCGASKSLPWCDGSHYGTESGPVVFIVKEAERVAVCQCRHTENAPRCDGSHRNL